MAKISITKLCLFCGVPFETCVEAQKYCSKNCRNKASKGVVRHESVNEKNLQQDVEQDIIQVSDSELLFESIDIQEDMLDTIMSSPRSTRAETAMSTMSEEDFSRLMSTGARYSASTLRKHTWVIKIYEPFTKAYEYAAWPMHPMVGSAFINFMSMTAKYAISSIEDVVIPSLKRLNIEKTGKEISDECNDYLSQALKNAKRDAKSLKTVNSKSPAIAADVQRIIECTPDGRTSKASEASLWLFGLCTGARAVTCSSVLVSDIRQVYVYPDNPDMVVVQIRLRVTKGSQNSNHEVTMEGHPRQRSTMDPVYWLEEHMKTRNMSLLSKDQWTEEQNQQSLWNMSRDVMRETFKTVARKAGFPEHMFGFHSLRSGFICSALLKAGTDTNKVQAVLENTAFVAGWVPHQQAQLRYVATCAKRTIISSRLVLANTDTTVIDAFLTNSETFHGITLKDPSWNDETNYQTFLLKIRQIIGTKYDDPDQQRYYERELLLKAYNQYVQSIPKLESEVRRKLEQHKEWVQGKNRLDIEKRVRFSVGRKHVAKILHDDFTQCDMMVRKVVDNIMTDILGDYMIKFTGKRRSAIVDDGRERYESNNHRKRIKWTEDEDRILLNGVSKRETFTEISKKLPLRTNMDCRDRLRNINKQKHNT